MNFWEAADALDTLLTVGQLALMIGCPVAGITAIAAKVIIKQSAKIAIKKCIATGVVSGITATACAFFATGTGEGKGNTGGTPAVPPGIPHDLLEAETLRLVVQSIDGGGAVIQLGDARIERQNLFKELLPLVGFGKLQRVEYSIELPDRDNGEWHLYMKEVESSLENVRPNFEFVETNDGATLL